MSAKRRAFALVFGIPALFLAVVATVGNGAGELVGPLVGGALGCALAGLWYRRRLARQRRKYRDASHSGQTLCDECGHEQGNHPQPGQADLFACAACVYEEDRDQRSEEDMCRRRYGRSS